MREFDHDGLLLCSIQSRLFEETLEKVDCSSEVFIRRYMNSKIVNTLDSTAFLDDNATTDNIIEEIEAIVYANISNIDCRISIQERLDKLKELKVSK